MNSIAELVNNDKDIAGRIKVVFLANFCVSLGEMVYAAAELSEQISMAGTEASGTGNMKFALNGAVTIGTLDGANIEIREAVGPENFFLFGHTVEQIRDLRRKGYNPRSYYESDPRLREVVDSLASGMFSRGDKELFQPFVRDLLNRDEYCSMADYGSYVETQDKVGECYRDQDSWAEMSILNVARIAYFSSDRSMREYCRDIWNAKPVQVTLDESAAASVIVERPAPYCILPWSEGKNSLF